MSMIKEAAWRRLDALPAHGASGWAIWRDRSVPCDGSEAVKRMLRNWNPLHRVLVGAPGAPRFVPPILAEPIRDAVLATYRRSMGLAVVIWALAALAALVATAALRSSRGFAFATVIALVALILVADYVLHLRRPRSLSERALFLYWLQSPGPGRVGLALWAGIGLAAGAAQLLLEERLGGTEALIQAWGVAFAPVRAGELWRLATGPFFHSGFAHFAVNFSSLLVIGPIAWAVFGPKSMAVFLAGNVAGALAQMAWGTPTFDSYAGVSGGFLALCGLVAVSGALDRRLLPRGFAVLWGCVGLITIAGAEMLTPNAATVGHAAGMAAGAACAAAISWRGRRGVSAARSSARSR